MGSNPSSHTMETVKNVLDAMEEPNRSVLEWILDLSVEVCAHEPFNRMTPHAMAVVFSPNLIPQLDDRQKELFYSKKTENFFANGIVYRQISQKNTTPKTNTNIIEKTEIKGGELQQQQQEEETQEKEKEKEEE